MINVDMTSHYAAYVLKRLAKLYEETRALARNEAFYCNALAGNSGYNISINCDMSVSCNCRDFDGSGHIGDLSESTLEDIFSSEKARKLRAALCKGQLPLLTCARCTDLKRVAKAEAAHYLDNYDVPHKGLMVENTINCNLNCRSCRRDSVRKLRSKSSLALDDVRNVSAILKTNNVKAVSYFNLGEPFLSTRILEELRIIRELNSHIQISASTNGSAIDTEAKREAALLFDSLSFSMDGASDHILTKYQRNGSFERSYSNMRDLILFRNSRKSARPRIEWKYVLFNWNDKPDQIQRATRLARDAGVDILSFWPTRSPFYGISWRYYLGRYFNAVGKPSWKGREIIFTENDAEEVA